MTAPASCAAWLLVAIAIASVSACGEQSDRAAAAGRPPVTPESAAAAGSATPGPACADGSKPAAPPSPPPPPSSTPSSSTTNEVRLEVHADCTAVRVGQPVHLRITASGSHHEPSISGIQIDGTTSSSGPACAQQDPNEQPRPAVTVQDVEHTYTEPGRDRIVVDAATFCSRFSGFARAELVLDVRP